MNIKVRERMLSRIVHSAPVERAKVIAQYERRANDADMRALRRTLFLMSAASGHEDAEEV